VQLRDGCVLNLESESLRLEAGSAFCNSSAFGAQQRGPQRAVTNAGEIWWDLRMSWVSGLSGRSGRVKCLAFTPVFFPDLIDENVDLHQPRRSPVLRQVIDLCAFVANLFCPPRIQEHRRALVNQSFVADLLGTQWDSYSLIPASSAAALSCVWDICFNREGDPTAVKWKGWDVLRLWRASNRTLEHTVTIHLCAIRLVTSGSGPMAQRKRVSYAMVCNIVILVVYMYTSMITYNMLLIIQCFAGVRKDAELQNFSSFVWDE